jgi:hypothetical protein
LFTHFSSQDLLKQFLSSPLGKSSLITSYIPDDNFYGHPCSASWFKQFCSVCPPGKLPLGLVLFFDHYEGSQNTSYGAYLLGVLNLKAEVLLSPISKMCVAVVPYHLDVEISRELILKEIKFLEDNGLKVPNGDGTFNHFFVRLAYISGDSKDLNGFIGLGSFNSKHGCRACWVNKDEIKNYWHISEKKTSTEIKQIFQKAVEYQNINEDQHAIALLKEKSIPFQPLSYFFRFLTGDWCQLSPRDILHAELLGLLKKELVHLFYDVLPAESIEKVMVILQQSIFPKGETNIGKKLDKIGSFNGREIKSLVYVLPFALLSLYSPEEPWLKCFIQHCHYFRLLTQPRVPKDSKQLIQKIIRDHHMEYVQLYPGKTHFFYFLF